MPTFTRTYSDFQGWDNHPLGNQLEKGIHICASTNMSSGIKAAYPKYRNVCSLNNLIKTLFPKWNSGEFQLDQFLELSSWLQKNQETFPTKELYEAFCENKKGIVMLMRKLTESGVQPDKLRKTFQDMEVRGQNVSQKEYMFLNVWRALDTVSKIVKMSYADYRKNILTGSISVEILYNAMIEMKSSKAMKLSSNPIIFLHGFYFITPEQQFFLEKLSKEFKVVMFLYYDPRYEQTFNFMDAFIQPEYGWEPISKEVTKTSYKPNHISDLFLSAYEKNNTEFKAGRLVVKSYENFFEFTQNVITLNYKRDFLSSKNEFPGIFSPNSNQMNELLINHYPELDQKNRNFLSYPVGRFFATIHEIYKDGKYEVSFDQLHELFSSGWLQNDDTQKNARDFTYDLKNIESYLGRASTLDEHIILVENLKKQLLFIESKFPIPADASRIEKSTRNPFVKNSHFSIEADRLNNLISFFHEIKIICNELFESGQVGTKINLHFKRLERVMNKRVSKLDNNFNEVEKKLVKDLRGKLANIQSDSDFFYNDLHEAVSLYLSGKFDVKKEEVIRPFSEIDGEAFKHFENSSDSKVYIGGLDEYSLPITPEVYHWPLQKATWISLADHEPRIAYDYMRKDARKKISRYLFYITLRFIPTSRLELSWIRHFISQEERKSALYIRQLDLPIEESLMPEANNHELENRTVTSLKCSQEELKEGYSTIIYTDFFAEYVQCPKRFYYSYLMQEYPVFQQEFTQVFLFTELVKVSAGNTGIRADLLYDELDNFFPQWIKVKKNFEFWNAISYAYGKKKNQQQVEEGLHVSEVRKNFQFPGLKKKKRKELFDKANTSHLEIEKVLMEEEVVTFKPNAGYHCRFCPHIDICPSAIYSVDLKRDRDE